MESAGNKGKSSSSTSGMLGPGFRFHPTDEELVRYYLRRKVCGKAFRFDAISEVDIYKAEPWDLPCFSKLKSRDIEWYFFSVLDKKYGNGARTNRATGEGYWKTTGKDRAVHHKSQIVGMKKTLVYHIGRAPKGQRTNWVMHEYRLTDLELERAGIVQDAFVLCRIFQKSGSGPKNGEQYGAPFVEEEWEDDELEFVPEGAAEEFDFGDDAYLDGLDLEQILGCDILSSPAPLPLNISSAATSYGEETTDSINDAQTLLACAGEQHQTTDSINDAQKLLACAGEQHYAPEQHHDEKLSDLPDPYGMDVKLVKHEYIGESSKSGNSDDIDYLLDEPFLDSSNNLQHGGDWGFIEAKDFANPAEINTSDFGMFSIPAETNDSDFGMLEEYLTFCNATDDNSDFACDPLMMIGNEDVSDQALLPQKELNGTEPQTEFVALPGGQLVDKSNNDASTLSDKENSAKYQSEFQFPFVKQASQMLGSIVAPPAFAAEFPSKESALHLNSLYQPSSSAHVTAGMIQIRNLTMNHRERSMCKAENLNIVLSFGVATGDDGSASLESSISVLPGKTISTLFSRGWFYFIFFWVLVLYSTFKITSCICAN